MAIVTRRKIVRIGKSRGITLPAGLVTGSEAAVIANKWILIDPFGKASPSELVRMLARLEGTE